MHFSIKKLCVIFASFLVSCVGRLDESLLNLVLLNTVNIITPGVVMNLNPSDGQTVTNFDGRVIATFRKPLREMDFQGVQTASDCIKPSTTFLVYNNSVENCAVGTVAISTDRRTLTFTAGTNLASGTYQVRIQNVFDRNENRVDYQTQTGFTIQSSSDSTPAITLGGTITGYTGSGLVLNLNSGTTVAITTGSTSYSIPNVPVGNYSLAIQTNPTGQVCTFTSNSAFTISGNTSDANISSLNISCTTLANVAAVYPTNGANWNSYIAYPNNPVLTNGVETPFGQTDTACSPSATFRSCIHGGVLRQVQMNFLSSCNGITAYDYDASNNLVNALQWMCMTDGGGNIWIRSSGLRDDKGLRDLVDFTAIAWKSMKLRIFRNGVQFLETNPNQWWTNPVVNQTTCPTAPATGTVLLAEGFSCAATISLVNNNISIVSKPNTKITYTAGSAAFNGGNYNWLEINFESTGSCTAAVAPGTVGFWHVRNSSFINMGTFPAFNLPTNTNNLRIHGNIISGNGGFNFGISSAGTIRSIIVTNNRIINSGSAATNNGISLNNSTSRYNTFIGNIIGGISGTTANGYGSHVVNSHIANQYIFGINGTTTNGIDNGTTQGNSVFQNLNIMNPVGTGLIFRNGINENRIINSAFAGMSTAVNINITGTSGNTFLGRLLTTTSCTTPGSQLTATCAASTPSTHTLVSITGPFTSDFVGVVPSDSRNANATNTTTQASLITDWFNFENNMRAYVLNPTPLFPDFGNMGNCTGSSNCRIVDLSLSASGTRFRNVNPCPNGSTTFQAYYFDFSFTNNATCISVGLRGLGNYASNGCTLTALQHAVELLDDGIGNDNGFCESNEHCLYTPNIHAYQGHSTTTFGNLVSASLATASTLSCSDIGNGGTVQNISLWKFDTNGR